MIQLGPLSVEYIMDLWDWFARNYAPVGVLSGFIFSMGGIAHLIVKFNTSVALNELGLADLKESILIKVDGLSKKIDGLEQDNEKLRSYFDKQMVYNQDDKRRIDGKFEKKVDELWVAVGDVRKDVANQGEQIARLDAKVALGGS